MLVIYSKVHVSWSITNFSLIIMALHAKLISISILGSLPPIVILQGLHNLYVVVPRLLWSHNTIVALSSGAFLSKLNQRTCGKGYTRPAKKKPQIGIERNWGGPPQFMERSNWSIVYYARIVQLLSFGLDPLKDIYSEVVSHVDITKTSS